MFFSLFDFFLISNLLILVADHGRLLYCKIGSLFLNVRIWAKRLFFLLRDSPFFLSPGQRDFFFKPLYDARFGILHWITLRKILQDSFSFPPFGRLSINSWHHQTITQNDLLMGYFFTILFTDVKFVQDIFDSELRFVATSTTGGAVKFVPGV